MPTPKASSAITRDDNHPVETDEDRLKILDALLTGKTPKTVALDVGYHPSEVQKVAGLNGYPNLKWMQMRRDMLADRIAHPEKYEPVKKPAEPAAKADTDAPRAKAKQPAPQAPARRQPTPARVTPTATVTGDVITAPPVVKNPRPPLAGSLTDLVDRGRASRSEATRALAEALILSLRALRHALDADQAQPQPAAQMVQQPEPPAEPAKKKRKSPTGPSASDRQVARLQPLGVTGVEVKAWGAEHGFAVKNGPILASGLLDAYEEAHR